MKIENAYLQFVNQVNRNLTNNNVNVDRPRFIILFNDISNRYVEWILEKRNEDVIRYISILLETNKKLQKEGNKHNYDEFKLPKDYFDLANLHVHVSSGKCKRIEIKPTEVKVEDVEELYRDKYSEPSLEWRSTFYYTGGGKVRIFKKDFDIQQAFLSYYRYPKQVDIQGYIKEDGSQSQDVDPEFDDKVVGRILIAMAKEFSAINNDPNGYQMNSNKLFSSI